MVLSTSRFVTLAASAKCSSMVVHTPLSHQRAKRLYRLFHLPYTLTSKRHCAPLRMAHTTPSLKPRQRVSLPTYISWRVRKNARIFVHSLSCKCTLSIKLRRVFITHSFKSQHTLEVLEALVARMTDRMAGKSAWRSAWARLSMSG